MSGERPFKIIDRNGRNRCGVVASSLECLKKKAQEKLHINSSVKVVLECDGTLVDDEYFHTLETNTCLMILGEYEDLPSQIEGESRDVHVRQSSSVAREEYEELIDEVMKLKLKVGLLNIGEAAAELLTQKTKPKSAVSSPQKSSTTSPAKLSPSKAELAVSSLQVSSKASPESISSSSKKVVPPKLPTGELFTALSKLRDVRHNIAHDMKQHRDVEGGESFLENEIENVLQAQSHLKKRGPECNLFEEEINKAGRFSNIVQ